MKKGRMRNTSLTGFIGIVLIMAICGVAYALPSYLSDFTAQYASTGTTLSTCLVCHAGYPATSPSIRTLNAYGNDFAGASYNFTSIEGVDSDGDGYTNIVEITASTYPGAAALAAGGKAIGCLIRLMRLAQRRRNSASRSCSMSNSNVSPPEDFDLGNESRGICPGTGSRKVLISVDDKWHARRWSPHETRRCFCGAIVNASAVASAISEQRRDVTLLCAGTDGELAPEDIIGAGPHRGTGSSQTPRLQKWNRK